MGLPLYLLSSRGYPEFDQAAQALINHARSYDKDDEYGESCLAFQYSNKEAYTKVCPVGIDWLRPRILEQRVSTLVGILANFACDLRQYNIGFVFCNSYQPYVKEIKVISYILQVFEENTMNTVSFTPMFYWHLFSSVPDKRR